MRNAVVKRGGVCPRGFSGDKPWIHKQKGTATTASTAGGTATQFQRLQGASDDSNSNSHSKGSNSNNNRNRGRNNVNININSKRNGNRNDITIVSIMNETILAQEAVGV